MMMMMMMTTMMMMIDDEGYHVSSHNVDEAPRTIGEGPSPTLGPQTAAWPLRLPLEEVEH